MIKFLIYKYYSHQETVNTYQLTESNEDTNQNETTSNPSSGVGLIANPESMILYNNVSGILTSVFAPNNFNASPYVKRMLYNTINNTTQLTYPLECSL